MTIEKVDYINGVKITDEDYKKMFETIRELELGLHDYSDFENLMMVSKKEFIEGWLYSLARMREQYAKK